MKCKSISLLLFLTLINLGCNKIDSATADSQGPQNQRDAKDEKARGVGDASLAPVVVAPPVVPVVDVPLVPVVAPALIPPPIPLQFIGIGRGGFGPGLGHHGSRVDDDDGGKKKKACENSDAPQSVGKCSDKKGCIERDGKCKCEKKKPPKDKCEDSDAPTCGGKCPENQDCEPVMGSDSCECVATRKCDALSGGMCGNGLCDPGFTCLPGINDTCLCEPSIPACGDPRDEQCAGTCDEGFTCEAGVAGEPCVCTRIPVPCAELRVPQCSEGACGSEERCVAGLLGQPCFCEAIPEPCNNLIPPQCGEGGCDPGQRCAPDDDGTCSCGPAMRFAYITQLRQTLRLWLGMQVK